MEENKMTSLFKIVQQVPHEGWRVSFPPLTLSVMGGLNHSICDEVLRLQIKSPHNEVL
jgi:hypothetical protein